MLQKSLVKARSFNRIFLCRDRVWPCVGILCCDKVFLCRDIVWPWLKFYVVTEDSHVATGLAKVKRIYVATEYFCVTTESSFGQCFYVVTEYSYVATEFGLDRRF